MADAVERLKAALADRYRIERELHEVTIAVNLQHPHVLPWARDEEWRVTAELRSVSRTLGGSSCHPP